jgi:hypothetical protein
MDAKAEGEETKFEIKFKTKFREELSLRKVRTPLADWGSVPRCELSRLSVHPV